MTLYSPVHNNMVRLKCGNKVLYMEHKCPPGAQEPTELCTPGVAIHDNCCRCDCICDWECVSEDEFFDEFSGGEGTALSEPPYNVLSGTWLYTHVGGPIHIGEVYLASAGEGIFELVQGIESGVGEFVMRLKGRMDPSTDLPRYRRLGLLFTGVSNGFQFTGNFYVEEDGTDPRIVLSIEVVGKADTINVDIKWAGYPNFDLLIRLSLSDSITITDSQDLVVCAFETDVPVATPSSHRIPDMGADNTFTSGHVSVKGQLVDTLDAVYADRLELCPAEICTVSGSGYWTDNFNRYVMFDHVYEDLLNLPWIDVDDTPATFELNAATRARYTFNGSSRNVVDHIDQGATLTGICSETHIHYPINPNGAMVAGIIHGKASYVLWEMWYDGTEWKLRLSGFPNTVTTTYPFSPTGDEVLRLETSVFGGSQLAEGFVDGVSITGLIDINQTTNYLSAGMSVSAVDATNDVIEFDYFRTSIQPKLYCTPFDWDGQCSTLPDPKFHDDFNAAAGPIGLPYTVVNANGVWEYTGTHAQYRRTGGIGTTQGWLELSDAGNGTNFSVAGATHVLADDQSLGGLLQGGLFAHIDGVNSGIRLETNAGGVINLLIDPVRAVPTITVPFGLNDAQLGIYLCNPEPNLYQSFVFADGERYYIENIQQVAQAETTRRIQAYGQMANNFQYDLHDYLCTNVTTAGLMSSSIKTSNQPGTWLYNYLVNHRIIPPTDCPHMYDFDQLNNRPAVWWDDAGNLDYIYKRAFKLSLKFGIKPVDHIIKRIVQILKKRAKSR